MRRHEQLSLDRPWIEHSHADELAKMSEILDSHPGMAQLIEQDWCLPGLLSSRMFPRMSDDPTTRPSAAPRAGTA